MEPDLSTVFCPDHKAAMVLFLDRVYGIESHSLLLRLLEVGFLPDIQAAVSLDTVSIFLKLLKFTNLTILYKSALKLQQKQYFSVFLQIKLFEQDFKHFPLIL